MKLLLLAQEGKTDEAVKLIEEIFPDIDTPFDQVQLGFDKMNSQRYIILYRMRRQHCCLLHIMATRSLWNPY